VSALFTPDGILRYHKKDEKVGKSLEELGFAGPGRIRGAMERREPLALSREYSPLLGTAAFACFQPVRLAGFDELIYVYAAIPESKVRNAMSPILNSALYTLCFSLLIFFLFLAYFFRHVSRPVYNLSLACDAISRGNFETEIPAPHSRDEIGIMTQSLYRVREQLMMHITMRERSEKLLDIYTRLHRSLYRRGRVEDVFDEIMAVIGDFFAVRRASLVLAAGESARVLAVFEPGKGTQKLEGEGEKFLYHRQAAALISGKKYLSLNANALREQKVNFAGNQVLFLCVFPLLAANELRGYVIMEGDDKTGPVIHNDAALLFLAETISFMLTQREIIGLSTVPVPQDPLSGPQAEAVREPPVDTGPGGEEELPVIKAARTIEGLDVDKGLFHSGGVEEQYGELLRISARSFTTKLETMRSLYLTDLPAFGIEIHGTKGALNSLGAGKLGEKARELEFAAKAGDGGYCTREYPVFEEKLALFAAQLGAIAQKKRIPSRGPGTVPLLIAGLERALEASRMFDSSGSGGEIDSLLAYSWEDCAGAQGPPIGEALEKIADALEYMDYDGAEHDMGLLLEHFGSEHGTA
jgi:HAMP domain-containing protein